MNEKGVKRFSVSVPPKLLGDFDKAITNMGYERSRAVRLAMQNFLAEYRWTVEEGKVGVGALVMLYNHETRGLEEALTEIQHEYREVVRSTTHIHLDERNCLEILAVDGEIKVTRSLAEKLMKERGIKQLKLAMLTL